MSTTPTAAKPLPVRRIVTGHTPDGKAIFVDDGPVASYPFGGSKTFTTDLYWIHGFPPSNDGGFEDAVKQHDNVIVNPTGSTFRVFDMPPHREAMFHRTLSLDYGILISGSLTLVLDDNKRVVMKPGDVIVQRETIHSWINETDEWTRMYFVILRKPVLRSVSTRYGP
ncbi:uncharacterized protein PHACADRAFT_211736 [Phanerochaete carnosa HHB-10118-sp]|uniref:Cupin type-2 domain-containing protein n=1 Tax=Phanerochaete carnosa (strain HHB-10118-sp) TaxID=650164 RepID=K5URG6_PHACS|nr:uncharacterized protein PHACADRAFT_211736 [Phanerochaete carnosa HHB-10118-sp]EKM52481.1 hypothetical protein PHACADRAFT_211736 [Phanerochaete carnosa HHB-10118-sp]